MGMMRRAHRAGDIRRLSSAGAPSPAASAPSAARILAGIVSLLLAVGYSPPSPAAEWYYVVDANRGTTNGPFQLRDGDGIQIGSNQYQIVQAPPLFDIAKRTVAKVEARGVTPEAVLRQAWADAAAPTNRPLPELVFFNVDTNFTITLNLRRVDLADLVRYVCEIANLRSCRCQSERLNQPRDVLIFQPTTTRSDCETQVYLLMPEIYELSKAHGETMKQWLIRLGAFQKESDAEVQYVPAKNWLIIQAPREVHEIYGRLIQY